MISRDGNVYYLPQSHYQIVKWYAERAEESMNDEEVEVSDAWYADGERSTPTEIMNRARAAQMAVRKIIEDAKKGHEPTSEELEALGVAEIRKHTPTNCWCGQSWDLR